MKGIDDVKTVKRYRFRKKSLSSLFDRSEHLQSLIEYNPAGILYISAEGEILSANPAVLAMTGYALDEILHRNYKDFLFEEDIPKAQVLFDRTASGEPMNYELTIRHKDGSAIAMGVKNVPIFVEGRFEGVYAVGKDITEAKRTEEFLRKSDRLAVVGQMAAGIAHEIRNPLTAISGFVTLMQPELAHDARYRQYLEILRSEIDRIGLIVNEFLFLAKPQDSKFVPHELNKLIRSTVALIETQSILHNVQIVVDVEPDLPQVSCDESQIKQVFINFLKNAIEAMPLGGHLLIQARCDGEERVLIRFADTGCGIPPERLSRLGEPFYTTKEKGTGLGLMVSYKIIENHRGLIEVNSEEGQGTTIDVRLPIHPEREHG